MNDTMQIIIISGLSGAGKSRAANILEDIGYYCVDNLPVALLPKFAEFCISMRGKYEKVALVTDIRGGDSFLPLFEALETTDKMGCESRIIFLEADVDAIIRRYKESRRRHPLAAEGESIERVVLRESEKLAPVRERADFVINYDRTIGQRPQGNAGGLHLRREQDIVHGHLGDVVRIQIWHPRRSRSGFRRAVPSQSLLCGKSSRADRPGRTCPRICFQIRADNGLP